MKQAQELRLPRSVSTAATGQDMVAEKTGKASRKSRNCPVQVRGQPDLGESVCTGVRSPVGFACAFLLLPLPHPGEYPAGP